MEEKNTLMENSFSGLKPFVQAKKTTQEQKIADHKAWLQTLNREYPNENHPFKVAVYIRYFNQTKHENYLDVEKQDLLERIESYPQWVFKGFYVDTGAKAPAMEKAPEWCRLLEDCQNGKVDLIITRKVSSVSSDMMELTFLARYFASLKHPVGMYFISEDIFTLASYYRDDGKDRNNFFPSPDWKMLPDYEDTKGLLE